MVGERDRSPGNRSRKMDFAGGRGAEERDSAGDEEGGWGGRGMCWGGRWGHCGRSAGRMERDRG